MRRFSIACLLFIAHQSAAYADQARFAGTAMLGFPHILSISGEYFDEPSVSYGLGLGAVGIQISDTKFSLSNIEGRMRWHPWDGSFILGGILGIQSGIGRASKTFRNPNSGVEVPTEFSLKISSLYLTPHFGWLWRFQTGFVMGFELGFQVPFRVKSTFEVLPVDPSQQDEFNAVQATEPYKKLGRAIESVGDKLGRVPFPYVTAIRLGWSF